MISHVIINSIKRDLGLDHVYSRSENGLIHRSLRKMGKCRFSYFFERKILESHANSILVRFNVFATTSITMEQPSTHTTSFNVYTTLK